MNNAESKTCPKCGANANHSSGGLSHSNAHNAAHCGAHAIQHGNYGMVLVAAGLALANWLIPKKYQCEKCGHEFRA